MTLTVKIHLRDEAPFMAEMESLPSESATTVRFTNPKLPDGKRIPWMTPGAKYFIVSMTRVNFIEVMTSNEEREGVVDWIRQR